MGSKAPGVNAEKIADLRQVGAVHVKKRRRRIVASAVAPAAAVIGDIEPGCSIVGITNGQFSLIDIIEHVLGFTGPADLAVSTWTMGVYDQERAAAFYANGALRLVRFIVDPSIFGRKPELSGSLVARFGTSSFRCVNTHAKFCTITNDEWSIAIRSSMNLNPNRRLENFDIDDDRDIAGFLLAIVDEVFNVFDGDERTQSASFFEEILRKFETAKAAAGPQWGAKDARAVASGLKTIGAT